LRDISLDFFLRIGIAVRKAGTLVLFPAVSDLMNRFINIDMNEGELMKRLILSLISLCLAFGISAYVEPDKLDKLSYQDALVLMKEELQFTNELLDTQNIASRTIVLKQHFLKKRSSELLTTINQIKDQANQDEKLDLSQIGNLKSSLDSLRYETVGISTQIGYLIQEMQKTNQKKEDYHKQLVLLARNILALVEADKSPDLPPGILERLRKNFLLLEKAANENSYDPEAFNNFILAFGEYGDFLESKKGDSSLVRIYEEQLNLISKNMSEFVNQYTTFNDALEEYKRLLIAQEEANKMLEEDLRRIRQYAEERLYKEYVFFDSGSVVLYDKYKKVLQDFAKEYKDAKGVEFHIIGYADIDPIGPALRKTYPTNWELSLARATVVARYLMDQLKISPNNVVISGRGEFKPYFSEGKIDKSKSRRVEIKFVPIVNK